MKESMTSSLCCSASSITHKMAVSPVLSKERYLPQPALDSDSTKEFMQTALCGQALYLSCFKPANSVITCITSNLIKSLIFLMNWEGEKKWFFFPCVALRPAQAAALAPCASPTGQPCRGSSCMTTFSLFMLLSCPDGCEKSCNTIILWVQWTAPPPLQFSHICTQVLPLLFFDWALPSALPLKTDQNISSVITEHTWGKHSNGKVMCRNYLKCLSLFSWHLATGNNQNLMRSVCALQTISYRVPSWQNATAVLALPHSPGLIPSPVQVANKQRFAAVRVSASIKNVCKTRQLAKWRHRN